MLATHQTEIIANRRSRISWPHTQRGLTSSCAMKKLLAYAVPVSVVKGTVLFAEGQPSRGAFILCSGRVKLFTTSAAGKTIILGFVNSGEIIGLAGTLSGRPYEAWAEVIQPAQAGYVGRKGLIRLLQHHPEIALQLAIQLGESYRSAIAGVRVIGLSHSVRQKLATFLLEWYARNRLSKDENLAHFNLTHEEIGQVIGASRETVTRILSMFKKQGLIQWKNCHLMLTNRVALESWAVN